MRRHYAGLLRRAASLPSLSLVASLHAAALRRGAVLVPSLIHAYSACGDPASARSVFDGLPAQEQTLSARTALASAMSAHGMCRGVLGLFRGREGEMDDKAVTVVLTVCARAGMVSQGREVFARVRRPALQHYTLMMGVRFWTVSSQARDATQREVAKLIDEPVNIVNKRAENNHTVCTVRIGAAAPGRTPCTSCTSALEKAIRCFPENPGENVIVSASDEQDRKG
ncbi:hypothetical protein ZWY2020_052690 [Hordeum vulgare]|nr:hypothetical protein ZWY2020_052690 [Hordeum vulgare]